MMMNEEIRLGQCWMVRLSKRDLCVRLESHTPDGGWTARVMSHGRMVTIKNASQLLQRCDKVRIYTIAETTKPNRRSHAVPPPRNEPMLKKAELKKEKVIVKAAIPLEQSAPLSLLDAAAMVLRESQSALSTREIIALVVERGLWKPTGATPWATLNAELNRNIKTLGTQSRFRKIGRGAYVLR